MVLPKDFSLRRERVIFSGEQKLSVYCVLSTSLTLNVAPILCRLEGIPLPKNCCVIGILGCITGGIWKKIPYSRPNSLISIPYSRVNCVKTIPFTAAHAYRAHILPPPGEIQNVVLMCSRGSGAKLTFLLAVTPNRLLGSLSNSNSNENGKKKQQVKGLFTWRWGTPDR